MSSHDRSGRNERAIAGLSSKTLLVAGVVRDCAAELRSDVFRLKAALGRFRAVHWLLIESDSDDDTVTQLGELVAEVPNFKFQSLGTLRERLPLRTQRIAHCRNAYLQELRSNASYRGLEFLLVADFDGTNELIAEEAIVSCWDRIDWDVCTANQQGPYYDIWALRHPLWSPNDCSAHYRFLVQHEVPPEQALAVAVHSRMVRIDRDAAWIEVDSAFGGLAIYRRPVLDRAEYAGLDADGDEICEHVPLHCSIRANDHRIFINPKLINAGYTEHSRALLIGNRTARAARRLIRRFVPSGA